jgi:hypothetical protein
MIREAERDAFARFQRAKQDFACRRVTCAEGGDPPDFVCADEPGLRIGIELAEWLNEKQIRASKRRQRIREGYASLPYSVTPTPTNIGRVRLFPLRELPEAELATIRAEIEQYVLQVDRDWAAISDRGNPQQGIPLRDFSGFPTMANRVAAIDVFPRQEGSGFSLNIFNGGGGAYSPRSAFAALEKILAKKEGKYETLREDQALDELYLVLYWWQGHAHNSPYDAPGYGLAEIARDLEAIIRQTDTIFDKIFVFDVNKNEAHVAWSTG